jgi:hypothetical protein
MQYQVDTVVKGIVPEQLGPQSRKVTLHVFMCKILANMTQVSDVALEPLVSFLLYLSAFDALITQTCITFLDVYIEKKKSGRFHFLSKYRVCYLSYLWYIWGSV